MNEKKEYFMYGILVSYQDYLDIKTTHVIDDVFKSNDNIQGIFTGKDAEFIIIGQVLDTVESKSDAQIVPEISDTDMHMVKCLVNKKYGIYGEYHYYFVKK